jgi:hypothetical protein
MAQRSSAGTVPVDRLAQPLAATPLSSGRALPVVDPLVPLLPDGGLVRGKAVACGGVAAMSLAVSLAVAATASGSWLAVVGVPTFGVEAAAEFGIPLERVVAVDPGRGSPASDTWAELVAATFDGFEVVITNVPRRLGSGLARRVQARMQARQAVLIAIGSPGPLAVDVELSAGEPRWEGVAAGSGYLRGRRAVVTSAGRRLPRPRRVALWLPGHDGAVAVAGDTADDTADIAVLRQQAG